MESNRIKSLLGLFNSRTAACAVLLFNDTSLSVNVLLTLNLG